MNAGSARVLLIAALLAAGCGGGASAPGHGDHDTHAHDDHAHEADPHSVTLAPEAIARGGIATDAARPRDIEVIVEAPGEVRLNAERVVQMRPRFAGVLSALPVRLGETVSPGQRFATVHSNESLADYDIVAPIRGTVVSRDLSPGQAVTSESVLGTIADLRTVWVDFALYPRIAGQVRVGQAVRIRTGAGGGLEARGRVAYVGPLLEQDTRVSYGRVVLENPDGAWQPGLYVTAGVIVDRARAEVAVPEEAIVRTPQGTAVFRASGTAFTLTPIERGRSDGTWTEVISGLAAGDSVAVRNAFLLKAELGRGEAGHDH